MVWVENTVLFINSNAMCRRKCFGNSDLLFNVHNRIWERNGDADENTVFDLQ